MNNIDINSIVKIEQMPKVFSQLEKIGEYIDEQTKDIDILECTEENKQEIKNRRTEINNTLKLLDDKRKEIKTTLLEPYEIFNKKYEEECKGKLLSASEILKTKIDSIEEQQKQEKEEELRGFANQHILAYSLQDIIKYEDIGLNVTLSASMKSLKEEALKFIEKISNDVELIKLEEYSDEILLEYINNRGNYAQSKLNVLNRHKQLDAIKNIQESKQEKEKQEEKVVNNVESALYEFNEDTSKYEILMPKEIIDDEDILKVTFTIETTKSNIIELKKWLNERGIKYE